MGVRILHDTREEAAVLYCSTSGFAFGPLFHAIDNAAGCDFTADADERAEAFLRWTASEHCVNWPHYDKVAEFGDRDLRQLTERSIERAFGEWIAQEPAQYERERLAALLAEDPEDLDDDQRAEVARLTREGKQL